MQHRYFEEIHFEMDDVEENDQTVPDLLFDGLSDDTTLVDIVLPREKRVLVQVMVESTGSPAQNRQQQFPESPWYGEMGQVSAGTDTN